MNWRLVTQGFLTEAGQNSFNGGILNPKREPNKLTCLMPLAQPSLRAEPDAANLQQLVELLAANCVYS